MLDRLVAFMNASIIASALLATTACDDSAARHAQQIQQQALEKAAREAAWKAHLTRLAWDRAHPAEVAARKAREQAAAAKAAEQAREKAVADAQRAAREAMENDPCGTALSYEKKAAAASGNQETYDLSVSGLHYADECDSDAGRIVTKGYLLSFKAFAEHNLTSGDSQTDMNQAETLLAECQTLPGVYGTHAGAQCESQEEEDIKTKTNWDMESYDQ